MIFDVAIAGGGPAGLAFAIGAARRGLNVVVFDRQKLPADKACGEGLMPSGVRALEELGVRNELAPDSCAPFRGIRYVQEDGSGVEGALPDGGGIGIRRTALSAALLRVAARQGVTVRDGEGVRRHVRDADGVTLLTDRERVRARVLVAADGLHSPLRRAEQLDGPPLDVRRFGLRRHFALAPRSDSVEVHFAPDVEAYVTPCGPNRLGVAFLWEAGAIRSRVSFDALVNRFPSLRDRLARAHPESKPQGAGPLWQSARGLVRDRFVLLGDAAGYVDALTGEGLSLALVNAQVLARVLPDALVRGAEARAFDRYIEHAHASFARYERLTRWMLALARRPKLRRATLFVLGRSPRSFEHLLAFALR